MQAVVNGYAPIGLRTSLSHRLVQALAGLGGNEINDRGGTPAGGSDGAGGEVIAGGDVAEKIATEGRPRPADGHLQVNVDVNAARQDVLVGGINHLNLPSSLPDLGGKEGGLPDESDDAVLDADVSLIGLTSSDDGAVFDNQVHCSVISYQCSVISVR